MRAAAGELVDGVVPDSCGARAGLVRDGRKNRGLSEQVGPGARRPDMLLAT